MEKFLGHGVHFDVLRVFRVSGNRDRSTEDLEVKNNLFAKQDSEGCGGQDIKEVEESDGGDSIGKMRQMGKNGWVRLDLVREVGDLLEQMALLFE